MLHWSIVAIGTSLMLIDVVALVDEGGCCVFAENLGADRGTYLRVKRYLGTTACSKKLIRDY